MSGPLVEMVGGPMDGEDRPLNSSLAEQTMLYEAGDWSHPRYVHVYRSPGGTHPWRYEGTRLYALEVDVVLRIVRMRR